MKSNGEKGFYGKTTVNILYSFMITMAILILPAGYINGLIKSWADSQARNPGGYTLTGFGPALILLFALFGLFIFIVIFWTFQKRSLAYIERLTEGIAGIAAGDLGTNLEVRGEDEFAGMAQNLNAMVERIQVLMDKEREAEKSKNELITNIAHDLRTPLTSIIGYLELLSSHKEMTEETREKYTKIAYTKAKRLEDLIEDLFGLTKLSYGKMTMHISQVDIVKLIAQLMEEFYPSFAESRLAFALTSNVESLLINADPNLIARLFDNLINNAIKYGVDGKRVDVSIERLDNQVIITVTNYGKVIPEAELPLIFNKLYRVEQSRASETGGTGLGLAIAKNIAELHGGDIDVKSDLNGTSFVVRLKTDFDINRENFEDA